MKNINNNNNKRIILAGTPKFSADIFDKVISNFKVIAMIAQPDRASGRGNKIIYGEVKKLAIKNKIPILQPTKIKNIKDEIINLKPDLILTCAYGQYIPTNILSIPKYNSINIHASLLPRHRGAAPIHYSILSGDKYAGITIINMTNDMDAGDMLFKEKLKINDKTTHDLFCELSLLAKNNIVEWLNKYFNNDYLAIKQDDDKVTYSSKILKNESQIKMSDNIEQSLLKIRAFNKFPGTYIIYKNKKLKVFKATDKKIENSIIFKLSNGNLYITEVQLPGRKRMSVDKFLLGRCDEQR